MFQLGRNELYLVLEEEHNHFLDVAYARKPQGRTICEILEMTATVLDVACTLKYQGWSIHGFDPISHPVSFSNFPSKCQWTMPIANRVVVTSSMMRVDFDLMKEQSQLVL